MNCQTAQQTLELARPDHPEGAAIDEAAEHVKGCPSCRTAIRRQEQLDQRISELCLDVPVPMGLKERLLVAVEAASHVDDGVVRGTSPSVARVANSVRAGKASVGTRRRWLGMISLAAACVVAAGLGFWSIWPNSPSIDLDDVASLVATDNIGPEHLAEFTHFGNGRLPQFPATMITRMLVDPARRLENDVALYFFKVTGPRRTVLNGRLLVIPKRLVKLSDVPTAASFLAGPTTYKTGYCTTAWVEGDFVYVCCLSGENELHRLMPRGAAAI